MRRPRLVVPVVLLLAASCGIVVATEDLETVARRIDKLLISPCCGKQTIDLHESSISHQMRTEVRQMLAEGMDEESILDHYVAEHGEQILAVPRASGFNLMIYVLPLLVALIGLWIILVQLRRMRVVRPEAAPPPRIEPEYAERLARQLRESE
jgi:cytochrome c-type biogenesis protein CcmH